jgi:hypothetical protein
MTLCLILLAIALLFGASVPAQETVPTPGTYFPQIGDRKIDGKLWVTGDFYKGTAQTDWIEYYDALTYCKGHDGSTGLLPVRTAQFDWGLNIPSSKTAYIVCSLNLPTRTATSAGAKITALDFSYLISAADLTSQALAGVRSIVYASGVLNVIAAFGGSITTGTFQTVYQATPYLTTATFGTPAFVNEANKSIIVELSIVTPATATYALSGVAVHYTRAD